MNQVATGRVPAGVWTAVLLAVAMVGAGAAPTTSLDETDLGASARHAEPGPARLPAPTAPGIRQTDRLLLPEISNGNKNLDLLLELQGRPGEEPRQAATRSAEASAVAAALTDLRAKAVERTKPQAPAADQFAARPLGLPLEGLGANEADVRSAALPRERREWTSQLGGSTGSTDSRIDAYRPADRESGANRAEFTDDNLFRRLPKEVVAYLRENRYWMLGALAVVTVLGAALKPFVRRT